MADRSNLVSLVALTLAAVCLGARLSHSDAVDSDAARNSCASALDSASTERASIIAASQPNADAHPQP